MIHIICSRLSTWYQNLKVNETHFRGINSGINFDINDSPSKTHQLFYPTVISKSGNAQNSIKPLNRKNCW